MAFIKSLYLPNEKRLSMTTAPRIILNNVSFHIDQSPVRFAGINLTFESIKYGIVGKNGIGKTTLLKLLAGELVPDSGSMQCTGTISLSPQSHAAVHHDATISDALGVTAILHALSHINKGSVAEADFDIVAEHWDIQDRIEAALTHFNLQKINLNHPFHQLSGGQKTKVL